MKMKIAITFLATIMTGMLLTACSGGGAASGGSPAQGDRSVVTAIRSAASTTNCPNGGIVVDAGIDKNGNGILDSSEITSTQYVCNGANGSTALLSLTTEPTGTNCTNGGKKINVGLDVNENGILDTTEITSSDYVCNGSPGTGGTQGSNGYNSLISVVSEPSGSHCANGGLKAITGLDANVNGVLDSNEVSATNYICNGSIGSYAYLTSIALSPAAPTIATGFTQQFAAIGHYSDGTSFDITKSVDWSSSNTAVATITNSALSNGLATASSVGSSTITATLASSTIVSGLTTLTVTLPPTPSAPVTLLATAVSSTVVNLTWTDTASNETGFKIERGTDGTTFAEIGTTTMNIAAYSDTGLTSLTKYYYRVRADNTDGYSAYSNIAAATTEPSPGTAWFSSPYAADGAATPSPSSALFARSTGITKMDVGIVVDTTGSMGGTISGLKNSLSLTVIPALKGIVSDTAIGIAGQDDFPYSTYGDGTLGDQIFYVASSPNGFITTITVNSQTAANSLTTHYGGDGPEGQVPAMYYALSGAALTWPTGSIAAAAPPAGTFGGLRFRSDALPVIVSLTDIGFHNGKRALDMTGTTYDSTYQDPYSFTTYNVDDLVARINTLGVKFIGGAADGGSRSVAASAPYGNMAYVADKSNSLVPPSAFTNTGPCGAGSCCAGVSGVGVAPDGPTVGGVQQCRLVFSYNANGTGLDTGLVNSIKAMVNSLQYDVYAQLYNDAAETIDAVGSLVQKIEPVPSGGTDPVTGTVCATFDAALLRDYFTGPAALVAAADGFNDAIAQVGGPSAQYCFKLTPKPNSTLPSTLAAQVHRIWLRTRLMIPSGGTIDIGADQPIYFIVP